VTEEEVQAAGAEGAPRGWYLDPDGGAKLRLWNGSEWTEKRREPALDGMGTRAKVACAFLGIAVLVNLAVIPVDLNYADRLSAQLEDRSLTLDEAEGAENAFVAGGLFYLVTLLAGAIAFIAWFRGAYESAGALSGQKLRRSPAWAVFGWFIPILALWWPKQTANDIWRGGDPAARGNPDWTALPVAPLVNWWWALWLLAGFAGAIVGNLLSSELVLTDSVTANVPDQVLKDERTGALLDVGASMLLAIAGVLAFLFVTRASKRQQVLFRDVREREATNGAPQEEGKQPPA